MENIMKRHNGRIIAVLTLYNMDLSKLTDIETLNVLNDIIMMEAEEEYPVEIDNLYAHKIVDGVVNNLNAVDAIIIKSLVKYTIDRLSYVDRALIRVATYEMKFLGVDPKIAINEAVEITKEYSAVEKLAKDGIEKVLHFYHSNSYSGKKKLEGYEKGIEDFHLEKEESLRQFYGASLQEIPKMAEYLLGLWERIRL